MNKMLIVDDDSNSLYLEQIIAQRLGFYTKVAVNGLDAIKIINDDVPDIILLDIFMPQMDGFETLTLLREKYNIPTIIITAGGSQTIKKLNQKNVKYHIQKPITPTKLQKELTKYINSIKD